MKLNIILLFIGISINILCFSQQNEPKGFQKEKVFWGGNLGASFGTVTNIDISPSLGYFITPKFAIGTGISYQYVKDRRYIPDLLLHIGGARAFTRLYPFEQLFLHGEYEYLRYRTNFFSGYEMETIHVSSLLGGGGYRSQIGRRSYAYIMLLYNFTEPYYSLNSNPLLRIGVDIGL
jgi:hypothetical protein